MERIDTKRLEVMMQRDDDLAVVNALPEESAREAHIRGTPNISVERDDFVDRVAEVAGGTDQAVVVYCASAECSVSEKAANKLEENGFERVYDYVGGVKAWEREHADA